MDEAIEFIKHFELSVFGLDTLNIWIALGLSILVAVLAILLTSFLQPEKRKRIRKYINIVFSFIFGGILIFMVLNSILTERYDRLALMVFIFVLPYLKKWVGEFYKRYDRFVDRAANK